MNTNRIYKPRSSNGWVWVGGIALALLAVGLGLVISVGFSSPLIVMILLALVIGSGFLLLAVFFPFMRYEFKDTCLAISYGPLLRYTVNFAEIKDIRRRDLGFTPVSSFRFPGLALFGVPYPEVGTVKMCATAASHGILLIDTGAHKYGITPADEAAFVAELRNRMGR